LQANCLLLATATQRMTVTASVPFEMPPLRVQQLYIKLQASKVHSHAAVGRLQDSKLLLTCAE
jgi:hypothetical protein